MTLDSTPPFTDRPCPDGQERLQNAARIRNSVAQIDKTPTRTKTNGEEQAHEDTWPASFSKGLQHDPYGMVLERAYCTFASSLNTESAEGSGQFHVPTAHPSTYRTQSSVGTHGYRRWDSPRAGHAYDLTAPDSAALSLAAAPYLGSAELTAEMAELYGMALLRDVSFAQISEGSTKCGPAGASPADVVSALNTLNFFRSPEEAFDPQPLRRRTARLGPEDQTMLAATVFRGSTIGAKTGPYLSQFLLAGSKGLEREGVIAYGAQRIDQRIAGYPAQLDHLGDWNSWLDVQNGADVGQFQSRTKEYRFLTTPRDLASYVHLGQLYQPYLNAALLLLSHNAPFDPGFPTGPQNPTRTSYTTFGTPDLLAVLAMVTSPALKAVYRQKFNHHRRARPERIAGALTLVGNGQRHRLRLAAQAAQAGFDGLEACGLLTKVAQMNANSLNRTDDRLLGRGNPGGWLDASYLLPMAYIEGSPMSPSYGSGHAVVAGACVTVLKAFFDTFTTPESWDDRTLSSFGMCQVFEAKEDGSALRSIADAPSLTLTGELDKLAANISLGRCMAGVNYYSDYFDSLRMGERIAIAMLRDRMMTYQDPFRLRLRSFDGDLVSLVSEWGPKGDLNAVVEINEDQAAFNGWWTRHLPG